MKYQILHYNQEKVKQFAQEILNQEQFQETTTSQETNIILLDSKTALTKETLENYPNLKYILACSNGINHIDKEYCKDKNIQIINAMTANINATAEHTTSLMLTALRKIPQADATIKQGKWNRQEFYGKELSECTIGFIGFGNIAKLVYKKLQGFEPKQFLCFDPFLTKEQIESHKGCTKVETLEELYKDADIISIHVPLLPQTKYMIAKEQLAQMKEDAILINAARGGIVKEEDLIFHLKNNAKFTAVLDTFEQEPTPNQELTKLPNTICTPHIGSMTHKAQDNMIKEPLNKLKELLEK